MPINFPFRTSGLLHLSLTLLGSCLLLPAQAQVSPPVQVQLVPWANNIQYITDMASCGDGRLFVVSQGGSIWVVTDSMTVLPDPFLNIYWLINFSGEQGLIGLAFDPDYANNGHFYVNYTQPYEAGHNTIISRFTVTATDPNVADPNSEVVLMSIPQPGDIHKGGDLEFDAQGNLYLSIGDGGPQGDPPNNAQNLNSRLGKILRIQVHTDGTWTPPVDNPFANALSDTLPEIFAHGVRNPFRLGLDRLTGDLWFGDVGQSSFEEVNFMSGDTSGVNFGWRCYEGNMPYLPGDCADSTLLQFPVAAHANIMNGGNFCALIGGKVYRGPRFPRLYGRYLYTDYCSGVIRSILPADGGDWTDEQVLAPGLAGNTCIAEDSAGELYLANQITQRVYKLVDRCPMPPPMLMDVDTALQCSDATGYAWYRNGELLPAETGQALHFPADGSYWVVADMGNGCLFTTDTVQVVHTGLPASVPPDGLKVFPNPAMDHLRISLPQQAATSWAITLLDLSGRPVRNWTSMGDHPRTIAVNGLVAGRYLLRVTTGSGTYCAPVGIVH
ncbi:MAG: PQQ-dependent sugar dehydrogenase [Flavobacteriales bacterium]|nr:PQQ-dependent sugar dehydrogenase [Flavobacteriales bacterium]